MSKLRDLLSKRKTDNMPEPTPVEEPKVDKYTRTWAGRVTLHQGFVLSDNDKKVDGILAALNRRDGQCPCGGTGAQFKCPCVIMRTKGICKCGLFQTIEDRKVSASSSAKIKPNTEE